MRRPNRAAREIDTAASNRNAFERRDNAGLITIEYAALADETPVEIRCNGEPVVVTMATPNDLEDLAVGFLFSERIIKSTDVIDTHVEYREPGFVVDVAAADVTTANVRAAIATSSCGLCGVRTLAEAIATLPPVLGSKLPAARAITRAATRLRDHQPLNQLTRAVHGAAWCDSSGHILVLREDIGRHNALDKLLGAVAQPDTTGFVIVSSRVGYELVQKCAAHSVSTLVAISAPSALAVRLASSVNINLIAVARADNHQVYTRSDLDDG